MSWQAYVDNNMVGTQNAKFAAICGLDGNIWAKSEGWNITPAEVNAILKNYNDPSSLAMSGLTLGGEKYIYLSGDSTILRGKKGTSGIHIAKTKTAVLVAKYEEPTQPCQCAKMVEGLADYLSEQGY